MQQYCAVLVFTNKNEREKHCTMVTAIVPHLDLDKWYIAIHSAKQYYSSGGNSRFIKHITGSGKTDESPKRFFWEQEECRSVYNALSEEGGNLNKSVCVNGLGNVF